MTWIGRVLVLTSAVALIACTESVPSATGGTDLRVAVDLAPSCSNGLQDDTETDVDCGGGTCSPCGADRLCHFDSDCLEMLCINGHCAAEPTCADGRLDGEETDTDCGGPCPPCGLGLGCNVNADCESRLCTAKQCATLTPRALSFSSTAYLVMGQPRSLAIGDVNGDKVSDLCVGIEGLGAVGVLAGHANGTFDAVVTTKAVLRPDSVAAEDLNLDGIDDVAVGDGQNPVLGVLMGKRSGLTMMTTYPAPANVESVAMGDFTGDGRPDVAAGVIGTALLYVTKRDATLESPTFFAATGSTVVALLPLGPGKATDLIAGSVNQQNVCLATAFPGTATCTAYNIPILAQQAFTAGDFDGDGQIDLLQAGLGNQSQFTLFLGQANRRLKSAATVVTDPLYGQGIAQADFNADGWPDFAVATDKDGNVKIFTGDGVGGFHMPPVLVPGPGLGRTVYGIVAGDFNRDGLPDLAATYSFADRVVVFLNTSR